METIKKYYLPIKNNEQANNLKIEIYYDKGGYNYFTSRQERRGYYVSVIPVERINHGAYCSEKMVAFSGYKQLLKEVARKSNKAAQEVLEQCESIINAMIDTLCNNNGFELE